MLLRKYLLLTLLFILPTNLLAQEAGVSIDSKINEIFAPLSTILSDIVFASFSAFGTDIPFIVLWLIGAGIYFTFYMDFINLKGFKQAIRIVSGRYDNPNDPGEITHFQALSAAVSGTVGLGNIAGVAIAISIGGPGATFWMILGGFFGMTTKFVECTLGVKYRKINENGVVTGGPMYYLRQGLAEQGLPTLGKILGALSAIICIAGALGSGALYQVNQSTAQFINVIVPLTGNENSLFYNASWVFGLIYASITGFVIIGGIKKISHVTEILVPFMAFIYITASLLVIAVNFTQIPTAFAAIFNGAFSPEGVAGGFIGVLIQGLRRSSFSNEAGLGSAAIAHAAAKTNEPVAEGLVALMEPFFDTVVICTLTALVIIITGMHTNANPNDGIALTSMAFESVFSWFPYVLAVAVLLFAFSTSITWFYYGQRCFLYLVGESKTADILYKGAFLAAIVIGSAMNLSSVISIADSVLLGMGFPNILGLIILAPLVRKMLKSYLARLKNGEIKTYNDASLDKES